MSSAAALAAGEIAVRILFRYNTPDTLRDNSLRYTPSLFSRHVLSPDQHVNVDEAWGIRPGSTPTGRTYTVNAVGTRGAVFTIPKPPGLRRVVVLGGSSAFDVNAADGSDWPTLAGRKLNEMGFLDVEVINAAVPGHASFDALGRLYSQVWTWEPDFVLLYGAWNDVKYFSRISPEAPLLSLYRPYDETEDPLRSYRGPIDRWLCHSQLYVKLRTRYILSRLSIGSEGALPEGGLASSYSPLAVEQYRLNIWLFVDAARHRGIVPVLLTEASLITPQTPAEARRKIVYGYVRLEHDALVQAVRDCNTVVREIARDGKVDLIDLDERLSGQPQLFADHVHTTAAGSERIASLVSEQMVPLLRREQK